MDRAFAEFTAQRLAKFARPTDKFDVSHVYKHNLELFIYAEQKPIIYWMALDEMDVAPEAWKLCCSYHVNANYSDATREAHENYRGALFISGKGVIGPVNGGTSIPNLEPYPITTSEKFMLMYFSLLFHGQYTNFTTFHKADTLENVKSVMQLVDIAMPERDVEISFVDDRNKRSWLSISYMLKPNELELLQHPRCMIEVTQGLFIEPPKENTLAKEEADEVKRWFL